MKAGVVSTSSCSSGTTSRGAVRLIVLFGVAAVALPARSLNALLLRSLPPDTSLCLRGVPAGLAKEVGRRNRSYSRYFAAMNASFLMSSRPGFRPPCSAANVFSQSFSDAFSSPTWASSISLPLGILLGAVVCGGIGNLNVGLTRWRLGVACRRRSRPKAINFASQSRTRDKVRHARALSAQSATFGNSALPASFRSSSTLKTYSPTEGVDQPSRCRCK